MGTLYIDRKNIHVKLDGNALAFYANGVREGIAPVNPLSRVVGLHPAILARAARGEDQRSSWGTGYRLSPV